MVETLTHRERMLRTLRFEPVDRVPDLEFGAWDQTIAAWVKTDKPDGTVLVVEPWVHVSGSQFERTVRVAENAGLGVASRPRVKLSRAVLMARS